MGFTMEPRLVARGAADIMWNRSVSVRVSYDSDTTPASRLHEGKGIKFAPGGAGSGFLYLTLGSHRPALSAG